MANFSKISDNASKLLNAELKFDLGGRSFDNDVTSTTFIDKDKKAVFFFVSREPITLCGINFIDKYLKRFSKKVKMRKKFNDGAKIKKDQFIAEIYGNCRVILSLERTLLNFLQHLSSISTTTSDLINKMGNSKTKLLDTRKTTTGLRLLEKYATSVGGAKNHRLDLSQKILLKDNHISLSGNLESIMSKINMNRIKKYQIECDKFEQAKKLIKLGCRHLLLDNMEVKEIKKCISLKGDKKIIFEISGGINFKNIKEYANLGADYISAGFITNSRRSVDIGLDII